MLLPVVNCWARDTVLLTTGSLERDCPVLLTRTGCLAATTMSNSSLTVPPRRSSAVTFTVSVPASDNMGVPEKVRVPASKESHVVESALPSPFVAVKTSVSVVSVSLKTVSGNA